MTPPPPPPLNRRVFLHAATLIAAAPGLSLLPAGRSSAAVPRAAAAAASLRPFALKDVTLGPGVFAAKRALMLDYARGYDVDRLLQVFRANAGLDARGAVAPGGWEGLDGEANGNLRGHYTGHFLSMLAQSYGSTGEEVYAERIRTIVGALTEVREALRREPAVLSVPGRSTQSTGDAARTAVENVRGSYQYVELPPAVLNASPAVTLSAWVRPTHNAAWARVFDFGDGTTRYLYLAVRNASGVPRFALTTGGAGAEQAVNGTAPLPLDRWSHLAVTLSGTTAILYVDGVAVGRNTAMTLTPRSLGTPANNWLGRSNYPADPLFAGALDDVDIWSRALSPAEVAELGTGSGTAAPSAGAGDLASYRMDETSGGTLADASGRALHATLRRSWGGPSHPGFLAAYPETQFIALESMTRGDYTAVWAPYYTAHKILRGLLDAYLNTDDARALDLAAGLCDWMHFRLSRLPASTLQRMWGIFSSGEFGGIVEAICDLYALTHRPEHLALARLFDLDRLIDACVAGDDILDGMHANQHIPIFTGLVRLYEETGEARYLTAARNFWDMVVPHRTYGIGGTSTAEFWRARGVIAGTLSDTTAETCCAYNMLKLSRTLFFHDRDPKYMDYYERALHNQVLGSKQDRPDAEKPLVTYFIGLLPGQVRDYTPKAGTTCCEGTGMESATKYQDSVYFAEADGSALYVNLYSASTLTWADRGVTVTQTTDFPVEQGSTLTINTTAGNRPAAFDLRLRVPEWARDGVKVTVNGVPVPETPRPGGYFTLSRTWRAGDTVRIDVPFRLRTESALDAPATQTLFYGPVNLVARDPRRTFLPVSLHHNTALSGDLLPSLTPVPGSPLHFTTPDGITFAPFAEGTEDPTHAYIHRTEPRVVLGTLDSGVTNPSAPDGTTLLDAIWAGAPFASKRALVDAVAATVRTWTAEGRLSEADGDRILSTARRASYQP
ncbi:beta-L-arabinofuranosidase domain-containing protein [Streptomyces paludis]|uniref:Glycosylase n=1 Tax=Streptomyces paludis TaxID=2282738 RepID=A0A345HR59_9ACTN|nr:beta-L-arabinofuranosidase domain-containing protein [Streptomyces paludis]AXG79183.1 glycosylase [Streptomyces paludis]